MNLETCEVNCYLFSEINSECVNVGGARLQYDNLLPEVIRKIVTLEILNFKFQIIILR